MHMYTQMRAHVRGSCAGTSFLYICVQTVLASATRSGGKMDNLHRMMLRPALGLSGADGDCKSIQYFEAALCLILASKTPPITPHAGGVEKGGV